MIIIAHRGLLDGPDPWGTRENSPESIEKCIKLGYHVEVDVWANSSGTVSLGHNGAHYPVTWDYLKERAGRLWVHAKNVWTAVELTKHPELNWFFHQDDPMTLTSKGNLWVHPNTPFLLPGTIAVLPETWIDLKGAARKFEKHKDVLGICTDYPVKFAEFL